MKHLKNFQLFESKKEEKSTNKAQEMIDAFKKKYGTELDEKFDVNQIKLIESAFEFFDKKFIKNKIQKIILDDLGGVHGRWSETKTKKHMTLNPSIFKFKKEFENGNKDVPYKEFVIVHEIGHCVDHIERVSYSKTWQAISGWKRLDRDKPVPEGYVRYVEKRKGREIAGPKRSNWIYKEDADFCRKYTSRNPREEFADCFAFGVFGAWDRFKGEDGQKKMEIIKKVLKKVD
jgi:hypothetical protein